MKLHLLKLCSILFHFLPFLLNFSYLILTECLDEVEPEKIQKYKEIKETIETLQNELGKIYFI